MPMLGCRIAVLFLSFAATSCRGQAETERIDELIKQWAPMVWLAPGEKFLPLSIEEFLENVYPGDDAGQPSNAKEVNFSYLPLGRDSESLYLHTKENIDLKNKSSFLFGKDPSKHTVPIYVTVSHCDLLKRTFLSFDFNSNTNSISVPDTEVDLNFHLTYWLFYPFNQGKEVCYIGKIPTPFLFDTCFGKFGKRQFLGNHVGDFEHLSLSFRGKPYPDEIYVAVHDAGAYYKYDVSKKTFKFARQVTRKGIAQMPKFPPRLRILQGHPVLFAAEGSHGLWAAPGEHYYLRVAKLSDRNGYGIAWQTWKNLKIYHLGFSKPPMWMKYQGRWGHPKSNCFLSKSLGICEYSDGPQGVLRRSQDFYCVQ